jgi:small conductance mechanosensitive channel
VPLAASWLASATPEPSPAVVLDPPNLPGDPTQLQWWVSLLTGTVLRVVAIVVIAVLLRWVLLKAVDRFVQGLSAPGPGNTSMLGRTARTVIGEDVIGDERRATRAASLGRLIKNIGSVIVVSVAALMVLAELGFNLAPLLAGAGVVGIAIGFGAQSVVADLLSGVFMLLEDQYGVGDVVDLGEATGTVEDVRLRVTQVRAADGVVWYVRNGEILRVGNMSQSWSRAVLDISVAYDSDVERVSAVMREVAAGLSDEEPWSGLVLEDPEVLGVERVAGDAIVIRLVQKTRPGEQWKVARELRQRIKQRFDDEGIVMPLPVLPRAPGQP